MCHHSKDFRGFSKRCATNAAYWQPPAGQLPDFGGPQVRDFESLAESWRRIRGSRRRLINVRLPFQFSRRYAQGALLCPDHKDGRITWEQYLERKYGS